MKCKRVKSIQLLGVTSKPDKEKIKNTINLSVKTLENVKIYETSIHEWMGQFGQNKGCKYTCEDVVGRERLLIGSAVSRTHSLLITHRNKHKSSSLTS